MGGQTFRARSARACRAAVIGDVADRPTSIQGDVDLRRWQQQRIKLFATGTRLNQPTELRVATRFRLNSALRVGVKVPTSPNTALVNPVTPVSTGRFTESSVRICAVRLEIGPAPTDWPWPAPDRQWPRTAAAR